MRISILILGFKGLMEIQFASMAVTSLYTNIPQEEGITTVCEAYEEFYEENPPIPTRYLREMPSLILQDSMEKITSKLMEQPWERK